MLYYCLHYPSFCFMLVLLEDNVQFGAVVYDIYFLLKVNWGTGMIASSSTFCPHPGRVIRDLFRQLHAVSHGMEALVCSNRPREAAASSYPAIIFGRIASEVPGFLRSTAVLMQLSHQCWRRCRLW